MKFPAALLCVALIVPALAQGPQEFERSTAAPLTVRDPFVYSLRAPEKKTPPKPLIVENDPQQEQVTTSKPAPAPKPVAPTVTVTGIVSGQTAILSNAGRSYVVQVGDKLGDYRVSAIGPRSVTLATGATSFKLPMQ